jgi:hypothetical protein
MPETEKIFGAEDMSEFEKDLATAFERDMTKTATAMARATPQVSAVPKTQPTLIDQWVMKEKIEHELRTRIRRERTAIAAEHARAVLETNTAYDKRVDEEVTKLELARRVDLQAIDDRTSAKLHEHDRLAQRVG